MLDARCTFLFGINFGQFDRNDADTLVGVIARSAGVWDSKFSSFFFHVVILLYVFSLPPKNLGSWTGD